MKVSARGYSRNCGERIIFNQPILDAIIEDDGVYRTHKSSTLYITKRKRDGLMSMTVAPRRLDGFGGNYSLYVDFTEDEVVKLFLECFPQLRDVIGRLSARPVQGASEPGKAA